MLEDPITRQPPSRRPDVYPGRLTILQAVWRNFGVALIPVVILVAIALAIGLARSPTYTSQAQLNVGGIDLTQQSIQGYTTAVQSLAVAYSEALGATGVVQPAARQLGLGVNYVRQHTSATPVQGTSVITVSGKSKQPSQATRLADAVGDSLVRYAMQLNSGAFDSRQLLKRFNAASNRLEKVSTAVSHMNSHDPGWVAALSRKDRAQLEFSAAQQLYIQSQQGLATTNLVQKLAPAAPPTSDRQSVLEDLLIGALLGGLLIGIGIAVWRANSSSLRRLGGP